VLLVRRTTISTQPIRGPVRDPLLRLGAGGERTDLLAEVLPVDLDEPPFRTSERQRSELGRRGTLWSCAPRHEPRGYLRLATAVMSTENLAMKLEPHQLEPGAGNGLIGVVAMPVAV
jgi:hypothetical protein